jgi:prepilin-type N-terminal cleavage/methylation domain-containing protein/prepilin-type processing-associated H-X9-DG protein
MGIVSHHDRNGLSESGIVYFGNERPMRAKAFTLVELLVVIGIIALLISILLPALNRAREAAYTIKCASNLHSIGNGMAMYAANYKGALPLSNEYTGTTITNGVQEPTSPGNGYTHWSSFLYNNAYEAAPPYSVFQSASGWGMFQCPSLDKGGLPPANTFAGNNDDGLQNESPSTGVLDFQAPRLSYTVNEALCPRGIFQLEFGGRGNVRAYHFIQSSRIQHSSDVILASELWGTQSTETTSPLLGSQPYVSASRRPVSGLAAYGNWTADQAYKNLPTGTWSWATPSDLSNDPQAQLSPGTSVLYSTLDWVGRNHGGSKKFGTVAGDTRSNWDLRKSNFLYVDGHVETKHVAQTVYPKNQWTDNNGSFFTLDQ